MRASGALAAQGAPLPPQGVAEGLRGIKQPVPPSRRHLCGSSSRGSSSVNVCAAVSAALCARKRWRWRRRRRAGGMLSQDLPDQRGGQQSCEGGHQQHEQDASNYGSDQLLPLPLFGPSWSQWGLCLDRQ